MTRLLTFVMMKEKKRIYKKDCSDADQLCSGSLWNILLFDTITYN